MNRDAEDEDVSALRAADPAAEAEAPRALQARVARVPHRLATMRRRLVPVAAVGALVVGTGGYIWGAGGIDLGPAPVPLVVETGTPGDPAEPIALGTGSGGGALAASAELQVGGLTDGIEGWEQASGRHRFSAPALDTAPSQARVFSVDQSVQFSPEDATRMARALGIAGEARTDELGVGWLVGEQHGPALRLQPWGDAGFYSGIPDAVAVCDAKATALHGREKMNDDGTWAFGQEMIRCMADTPMPSDDLVSDSVSLFLRAIGIDETTTQVSVTPDESGRTVMATAALIVEDNVTEIVARVTVSAQGITSAHGPTGTVVSLGDYAIVSPAEAAERLNDPAFSPQMVSRPERPANPSSGMPPSTPPALPEPDSAVPWPVLEHEIVSVRLGLSLLGADGVQYLAPAYEFTASDGTVWSVLALTTDEIDTAPDPG